MLDVAELPSVRCRQTADAFVCSSSASGRRTRLHTGAFWCLQQPTGAAAAVFNHSIAGRGHGNTDDHGQLGMCEKSAAIVASGHQTFDASCHRLGGRTAVVAMPPWHVYHFYAEFAFALYALMHAGPRPDHVVLFTTSHGTPNATARYRSLWEHDSSHRRVLLGLLQLLGPPHAGPDVLAAGTVLPSPRVAHVLRDVCMERASFGMRARTQLMFSRCQPFWLSTPGPSGSCAGFGAGRVPDEIQRAVDATDCAQTRTLFAAYHRRLHAWLANAPDGRVPPASQLASQPLSEPLRAPAPPPPPPRPVADPVTGLPAWPRRIVRVLVIERTRSRAIQSRAPDAQRTRVRSVLTLHQTQTATALCALHTQVGSATCPAWSTASAATAPPRGPTCRSRPLTLTAASRARRRSSRGCTCSSAPTVRGSPTASSPRRAAACTGCCS